MFVATAGWSIVVTPPDSPDLITVPASPPVPGLVFRRFRGESDYPDMVRVADDRAAANGDDWHMTLEDVRHEYAHLTNCDPATDMIVAEVGGEMIGYWRGRWHENADGTTIYSIYHFLHPAWRGRGIGHAALLWMEDRLRHIAAGHDPARPKFFQGFATQGNRYQAGLLEAAGYRPVRHFHTMVRPSLDDIPDFPLPSGLEVRPVLPEHYRAIWDADVEAFRDHWGFGEPDEADYQSWLDDKTVFQPALWQVAWDPATNEVAGQVRAYIDHAENERFVRRRGYTEFISVRRPYRQRGLARALIVRSLRLQRDAGMNTSALGADSESLTGATRVYEDCGFRVARTDTLYRKGVASLNPDGYGFHG